MKTSKDKCHGKMNLKELERQIYGYGAIQGFCHFEN